MLTHDKFVTIKNMTPTEIAKGGEKLSISYDFYKSLYGRALIASTNKGICFLGFVEDDDEKPLNELKKQFPQAKYHQKESKFHHDALSAFSHIENRTDKIVLHIHGSKFQMKVWNALLTIPRGEVTTYGELAEKIDSARASRAVGSAVGANPVSYIIPCHRVILSSGEFGDYRWGMWLKREIINSENELRLTFSYFASS